LLLAGSVSALVYFTAAAVLDRDVRRPLVGVLRRTRESDAGVGIGEPDSNGG
jgi:hypothetical protein